MDIHNTSYYPNTYEGLLQLLGRLRSADGCPWDQEQTRSSMKSLFLEECYELIEAIEENDIHKIVEELGDVLFHILFQIQIGEESEEFTQGLIFSSLINKLIRRHPHVFGDSKLSDSKAVKAQWASIKRKEGLEHDKSVLDGVPKQMPALSYAESIQTRALSAGLGEISDKDISTNLYERLVHARDSGTQEDWDVTLGDFLFSLVYTSRKRKSDAETSLRQANSRFYQRFIKLEELLQEGNLNLSELSIEEKENLWVKAKFLVE